MKNLFFLVIFCILSLCVASNTKKHYQKAYKQYQNGNYVRALSNFAGILRENPDSFYAANCYYWRGIIYLKQEDYLSALVEFESVLTTKNIWKYSDALTQAGNCYRKLKLYDQAKLKFKILIEFLENTTRLEKKDINKKLGIAKNYLNLCEQEEKVIK